MWQQVDRIPDLELWRTHTRLRERLVAYAREEAEAALSREVPGRWAIGRPRPSGRFEPDALTIGFARRFATYKRATLLFRDVCRLKAILQNESRPVQLLVSGKAHPRDGAGKEFIREMLDVVEREGLIDSVVFLEDYDLSKAAMLVQGVDVWLNTPRRPYEASGTSGMKVVPNGGLNLSVLDGWWNEAYRPGVGWAIGDGQESGHAGYQDQVDAESLYSLLENEVVPLFYSRDADGLPRGWIAMMKESIKVLAPTFSGRPHGQAVHRDVLSAGGRALPASGACGFAEARELAAWKARVREAWPGVRVVAVTDDIDGWGDCAAMAARWPRRSRQPRRSRDPRRPLEQGAARSRSARKSPSWPRCVLEDSIRPMSTSRPSTAVCTPTGASRTGRVVPLELCGHEDGRSLLPRRRAGQDIRSSRLRGAGPSSP